MTSWAGSDVDKLGWLRFLCFFGTANRLSYRLSRVRVTLVQRVQEQQLHDSYLSKPRVSSVLKRRDGGGATPVRLFPLAFGPAPCRSAVPVLLCLLVVTFMIYV